MAQRGGEFEGTSASGGSRPRGRRKPTASALPPDQELEVVQVGDVPDDDEDQIPLPGILDSPLRGSVKNERSVMVYNFFALTKEKRTEPIRYHDGNVMIEVKGTDAGIATIYDKEILIYAISLLVDRINAGERASRWVQFTWHDFCRVTRIFASNTSYERISGALERLQGTQVKTNIETGGQGSDEWFSWLEAAKAEYSRNPATGERRLKHVRVKLCDWLYRAVLKDRRFLTYDPVYFDLPVMEKRLYELARAHVGNQPGFKIGLQKLRVRVGSDMDDRNFKVQLKKIANKKKPLPEYAFKIIDTMPGPDGTPKRLPLARNMVVFWRLDRWREYAPDSFLEADEAVAADQAQAE